MYMKSTIPIRSPNVRNISQVCPSGQYLSLKVKNDFLALLKKEFSSNFTFSVMIDISFLLSLNLLAPNSYLLTDDTQVLKVPKLLCILVLCFCIEKNNDIYQILVVQVGLLLYLQSYLSIVLTVVKLLWYLRSK